jgi:DnaJ-class molecular chaperone
MVTCPNCYGRRALPAIVPAWGREACPSCHQTGLVPEERNDWVKCMDCNGYGWTGRKAAPQRCLQCKGIGIVRPGARIVRPGSARKTPSRMRVKSPREREMGQIMGRRQGTK